MLGLLTVGPKFTRPACHMQPTMRIARRCTALLLPRTLYTAVARAVLGQTDRLTDGRTDRRTRHRFNTRRAYARSA